MQDTTRTPRKTAALAGEATSPIFTYGVLTQPSALIVAEAGTITLTVSFRGKGSVNCNGLTVQMLLSDPASAIDLISAPAPATCAGIVCSDGSAWITTAKDDNAFLFQPPAAPCSFSSDMSLTITFTDISVGAIVGTADLYIDEWAAVSPATAPAPDQKPPQTPTYAQVQVGKFPAGFALNGFTAVPASIAYGDTVLLAWSTSNAIVSITYDSTTLPGPNDPSLPAVGNLKVMPTKKTTYTLQGQDGTEGPIAQLQVLVYVGPEPITIDSFTGTLQSDGNGGLEVYLQWSTTGATECEILGISIKFTPSGTYTISGFKPTQNFSYSLTASNHGNSVTQNLCEMVINLAPGSSPHAVSPWIDDAQNMSLYFIDSASGMLCYMSLNDPTAVKQVRSAAKIHSSALVSNDGRYVLMITGHICYMLNVEAESIDAVPLNLNHPNSLLPPCYQIIFSTTKSQNSNGDTSTLQSFAVASKGTSGFIYFPDIPNVVGNATVTFIPNMTNYQGYAPRLAFNNSGQPNQQGDTIYFYVDDSGDLCAFDTQESATTVLQSAVNGTSTACVVSDPLSQISFYAGLDGSITTFILSWSGSSYVLSAAQSFVAGVNICDMVLLSDSSQLIVRTDQNTLLSFTNDQGRLSANGTTFATSANPGKLAALPSSQSVVLPNPDLASLSIYSFPTAG